jgi:hypothetical protein
MLRPERDPLCQATFAAPGRQTQWLPVTRGAAVQRTGGAAPSAAAELDAVSPDLQAEPGDPREMIIVTRSDHQIMLNGHRTDADVVFWNRVAFGT